jgi:hypothetical protein
VAQSTEPFDDSIGSSIGDKPLEYDLFTMARGSHSGSEPDRRDQWPDDPDQYVEGSETGDRENAADGPNDASDWIASVRDLDYIGNGSTEGRGQRPRRSSRNSAEARGRGRLGVHWTDDDDTDLHERDDWWLMLPHEKSRADPDDSPALSTDTSHWPGAAPSITTRATTMLGRGQHRKGSGGTPLIVAAIVVLVVVFAVGLVIVTGRSAGHKSSSSAGTTARSSVTTTTAVTPTSAPSPASVPPAAPARFTVQSTCGGRACSVAVRDSPNTAGKSAGSLRNGDVVQVSCSTKGESVADRDTGQRSDVWYRLADRSGYASALYLTGPSLPQC